MKDLHSLLRRQLRRHLGKVEATELRGFIEAIDGAYRQFDADRTMLERSLELSSDELLQANGDLGAVFRVSPDLFVWIDTDDRIVDFKSGDFDARWFPTRLSVGSPVQEVVPCEARPEFEDALGALRRHQTNQRVVYYVRINRIDHCVEVRLMPLPGRYVIMIARDISERDRVEKKLRAGEERYRALFHASPVPMWVFDVESLRFLAVNAAAIQCYGYSREEFLLMSVMRLLRPFEAPAFVERLGQAAGDGIMGRHLTSDGTLIDVDVRSHELTFFGKAARIVLASNVTAQRRAEELRLAKEAAEDASQAKSAFLTNMSHELRTPLNAIIGYSEMLAEDAGRECELQLENDLRRIHSAGNHLLDVINDILDLSKIEAGRMELHPKAFGLAVMVEEVTNTIRPMSKVQNNRLEIRCPGDIGGVTTDRTRLSQSLLNLLSNACKFTENGSIVLDVTRELREGGAWIHFRVSDTGIGIGEQEQPRLFDEFTQVDASTTRRHDGTGLGLAISRRLCRMMGGDIVVESKVGVGSIFTISIPAVTEETTEAAVVGSNVMGSSSQTKQELGRQTGNGECVHVWDSDSN